MCCTIMPGWTDMSNGCDGTFGGATRHECVSKPTPGNIFPGSFILSIKEYNTFHIILVKRQLILILCFEGNADTYEQHNLKHCNSNKYGEYSTLSLAQSACSSDSNCRGVYDGSCDNSGSFYLCPTSADLEISSSSCVYKKKEG